MKGNNHIRVDDRTLPAAQKFLSKQSELAPAQRSALGVSDGPAQMYVQTMQWAAYRARDQFEQQQRALTAEVQEILSSLKDLLETDKQTADMLKRFLGVAAGVAAGAAAGAAGSTEEFG